MQGATVVEIAKRMGITGGALYRYFENKEEIFDAVVQAHSQPFTALESINTLIPELEPRTALKFILQGMLAYLKVNLDFLRLVVSEALRNKDEASPFLVKMLNPGTVFIRDCLASWQEKGLLRPTVDLDTATQTLMGMAGYFIIEKALMGNVANLDEEINKFIDQVPDIFLDGIMEKDQE
ncbi:MAG: TetR/AcrR family transcriptional regulator [Actinobacteria bacterium]|nr:TetR/AcrR family transcriptional regulator [Actinomycetota bacterium]